MVRLVLSAILDCRYFGVLRKTTECAPGAEQCLEGAHNDMASSVAAGSRPAEVVEVRCRAVAVAGGPSPWPCRRQVSSDPTAGRSSRLGAKPARAQAKSSA